MRGLAVRVLSLSMLVLWALTLFVVGDSAANHVGNHSPSGLCTSCVWHIVGAHNREWWKDVNPILGYGWQKVTVSVSDWKDVVHTGKLCRQEVGITSLGRAQIDYTVLHIRAEYKEVEKSVTSSFRKACISGVNSDCTAWGTLRINEPINSTATLEWYFSASGKYVVLVRATGKDSIVTVSVNVHHAADSSGWWASYDSGGSGGGGGGGGRPRPKNLKVWFVLTGVDGGELGSGPYLWFSGIDRKATNGSLLISDGVTGEKSYTLRLYGSLFVYKYTGIDARGVEFEKGSPGRVGIHVVIPWCEVPSRGLVAKVYLWPPSIGRYNYSFVYDDISDGVVHGRVDVLGVDGGNVTVGVYASKGAITDDIRGDAWIRGYWFRPISRLYWRLLEGRFKGRVIASGVIERHSGGYFGYFDPIKFRVGPGEYTLEVSLRPFNAVPPTGGVMYVVPAGMVVVDSSGSLVDGMGSVRLRGHVEPMANVSAMVPMALFRDGEFVAFNPATSIDVNLRVCGKPLLLLLSAMKGKAS